MINPGLSRKLMELKSPMLRLLTGAITVHELLNKHLFSLGVTDRHLCYGCYGAGRNKCSCHYSMSWGAGMTSTVGQSSLKK